ncbi:conserved hypothetical protein [Uncinocarpus reesii 1704]|uniref:Ubiquitin-like modifier HUB1 n=1 Tax=Uncinocarpus reesii (strain UAMH 1704) TaxID=336963 RepID=C4JYQ1_UNCRE|nr:uncharacterized protein UREG_07302 [Uncinocarpus reesii 1704]EEP82437.1 conserved hypothetical protein [Uncinocarpus reesii 1704]
MPQHDRGLERGYRERDRPRSPFRNQDQDPNQGGNRKRHEREGDRGRHRDDELRGNRARSRDDSERKDRKPKEKKEKKPAAPSEPMIVVYVNDRLGTKAAIPCLASDPIRLFKAQVAARIGREPHEILLKRQGERPFKDQLSLEDYGVSNGVQLDLEVDTGD